VSEDVSAPVTGERKSTAVSVVSIVRVEPKDGRVEFTLESEGLRRDIDAGSTVAEVFEAVSAAAIQWGLLGRRLVPECTMVEIGGQHCAEVKHWHGNDHIIVTERAANRLAAALYAWCGLFNFLSYYRRS